MNTKLLLALLGSLVLIFAACAPAAHSDDMMDDTMMEDSMEEGEEMMEEGEEMAEDAMMDGNIIEVAQGAGTFNTLLAALDTAGLTETLMGEGPFTVFAPTDDAFAAFLADGDMTAEDLLANPELESILLYHVVSGEVPASDVMGMSSGTTVQGSDVMVSVMDGSVMLNETVTVVTPDIKASNGIIHVVDGVLLPPM